MSSWRTAWLSDTISTTFPKVNAWEGRDIPGFKRLRELRVKGGIKKAVRF